MGSRGERGRKSCLSKGVRGLAGSSRDDAMGVAQETVIWWRNDNPHFQAELNRRCREVWGRLESAADPGIEGRGCAGGSSGHPRCGIHPPASIAATEVLKPLTLRQCTAPRRTGGPRVGDAAEGGSVGRTGVSDVLGAMLAQNERIAEHTMQRMEELRTRSGEEAQAGVYLTSPQA